MGDASLLPRLVGPSNVPAPWLLLRDAEAEVVVIVGREGRSKPGSSRRGELVLLFCRERIGGGRRAVSLYEEAGEWLTGSSSGSSVMGPPRNEEAVLERERGPGRRVLVGMDCVTL